MIFEKDMITMMKGVEDEESDHPDVHVFCMQMMIRV